MYMYYMMCIYIYIYTLSYCVRASIQAPKDAPPATDARQRSPTDVYLFT